MIKYRQFVTFYILLKRLFSYLLVFKQQQIINYQTHHKKIFPSNHSLVINDTLFSAAPAHDEFGSVKFIWRRVGGGVRKRKIILFAVAASEGARLRHLGLRMNFSWSIIAVISCGGSRMSRLITKGRRWKFHAARFMRLTPDFSPPPVYVYIGR